MKNRRVVVTGLGMVSPVGNDLQSSWKNIVAANSGIGLITKFDTSDFSVRIAGEVKNYQPSAELDPKEASRMTEFMQYAVSATSEALKSAGIEEVNESMSHRFGCSIGSGMGGLDFIDSQSVVKSEKGPKRVSPFLIPYTIANIAAGVSSIKFGLRGPNICTTTACTSGTHAVGEAFLYIKTGMADQMVAGGTESTISTLGIAAFASMKALSTNNDSPSDASKPFDLNRNGFVMGEGAGILILEELEVAKKRGAPILAEIVGYGMSGDASHITAPAPEGEGAARCMQAALDMAEINPDQVDYINAHGTSTKLNDKNESLAIAKVLGAHASGVSISSTKGVTGHCLGAAGGIEAVATVMATNENVVPPTAHLRDADPDCPLDYTPLTAKERQINYALSNSFGFGGTNGSLLFKKI